MDIGRSAFEMARPIEVRDAPGLPRRPPQQFPGPRARGRPVQTEEVANKTKMTGCLLLGLGYHRDPKAPADDIGDFPRRRTLVAGDKGRFKVPSTAMAPSTSQSDRSRAGLDLAEVEIDDAADATQSAIASVARNALGIAAVTDSIRRHSLRRRSSGPACRRRSCCPRTTCHEFRS